MIAWQEAVERAIRAAESAEKLVEQGKYHDRDLAQTYAQLSYAWSNIGMMMEAQETAETEAAMGRHDLVGTLMEARDAAT